jgi:hypothetical protein
MKPALFFFVCVLCFYASKAQLARKQSTISLPATNYILIELQQIGPQRISPLACVPFNEDKNGRRYNATSMAFTPDEKQTLNAIAIYRTQQDLSNFGVPIDKNSPIKMVPLQTIILNSIFSK